MSSPEKFPGRFATTTVVHLVLLLTVPLAATLCQAANSAPRRADVITCNGGADLPPGGDGTQDVEVTADMQGNGECMVHKGAYHYHNFNIYQAGVLQFVDDGDTELWAANILVENAGTLLAGTPTAPYGANGTLTIHLWGPDQGQMGKGVECKYSTDDKTADCGVPKNIWGSNQMDTGMLNPTKCMKVSDLKDPEHPILPGGVDDCFYQYMPLTYDGGDPKGYFGYKVLAVSYGGTLQLFGRKGTIYTAAIDRTPGNSGMSWARLAQDAGPGTQNPSTLVLDRPVKWVANDKIVVTTTDYLPGHSEQVVIQSVSSDGTTLTLTAALTNFHNGTTYDLGAKKIPEEIGPDQDPNVTCTTGQTRCVETRAAVGLLTRSIRIVSEGDVDDPSNGGKGSGLPPPGTKCSTPDPKQPGSCVYFGGHTIFRQGFYAVQVQGVEFYQLGQGGRIMHYPVHFHMARQTPSNQVPLPPSKIPGTFVKGSSVWDSMTRWMTLHATQGVTLARNVGYLSIGHGYYLEDGTETGNQLYANLGVFARAAVDNVQNPRKVPGILSAAHLKAEADEAPYHTDVDHPTVFWMMNGWNDFKYNMAAGAGSCGMCYWFVPGANSGPSRYEHWDSYAGEQQSKRQVCDPQESVIGICDDDSRAGITPLKSFVGNSCVSAQNSFITVGDTAPCVGVSPPIQLQPILNQLAPKIVQTCNGRGCYIPVCDSQGVCSAFDGYYPKVPGGGSRSATQCKDATSCNTVNPCAYNAQTGKAEPDCMITALDHYTSSFNWADTNLSAIWLRKQWYLMSNSAITDVQNGGLTFVSGGGYTYSDEVPGYWALAHKSAFIGMTQPNNPFASDAGPFNPDTNLTCTDPYDPRFCGSKDQGVVFPLGNFAVNQRFFNIYDGPSYESANAYLDISRTPLMGCKPQGGADCRVVHHWGSGSTTGVPVNSTVQKDQCYLPNAAIAWKQPNAFYYPPAFTSDKLFFDSVDIRHFVIEPLFNPGTLDGDIPLVAERYCNYPGTIKVKGQDYQTMFDGFTDIDRQTELTDDDGSLTGLLNANNGPTISVNKDVFFNVPIETAECSSDIVENMPPPPPLQGKCAFPDPDKPELCATANTSPYDYVTTVVFPGCAAGANPCADNWAKNCETQQCYGVPLYRETTVMSDNDKSPLIRMAGQGTYQRSTLTVNQGTYFLDTTVSKATQDPFACKNYADTNKDPCGAKTDENVFLAGQTYHVFLLYAKPAIGENIATKQKYRIYVGPGFEKSTVMLDRVDQGQNPPGFSSTEGIPWTMNVTNGILEVDLDMSSDKLPTFADEYNMAKQNHCAPATYCTWSNGSCGCAHENDAECTNACSNWAGKDINCPEKGCYGFEFTLDRTFEASDQNKGGALTQPVCLTKTKNPEWNTPFTPASEGVAGAQCNYNGATIPDNFCPGRSR